MAKKTDKTENPETPVNPNEVFLTIWRDGSGNPVAYGMGADKLTSRKSADRMRYKVEKRTGATLDVVQTVKIELPARK